MRDRVVLVTGAAGGIGRALCRRFAERGATLAMLDRDQAGLEELVAELPGARAYPADLTRLDELPAVVASVVADLGRIDILVNNAGLTVQGSFDQFTLAQIHQVMDVDLRAVMVLTHAAIMAQNH